MPCDTGCLQNPKRPTKSWVFLLTVDGTRCRNLSFALEDIPAGYRLPNPQKLYLGDKLLNFHGLCLPEVVHMSY